MIRNFLRPTLFSTLVVAFCVACSAVPAERVERAPVQDREARFSVLAEDERVGHLVAKVEGDQVRIDYRVSVNGRGPDIQEVLTLDGRGIPVEWRITGSSLFGARVEEVFSHRDGRATWTSDADEGQVASDRPQPYVANHASPWTLGHYASLLLAEPDRSMEVFPSGTLRLEELAERTVGSGDRALPVTIYSVSGVDLHPSYVALDRDGRMFARVSTGRIVVREEYEEEADPLRRLARDLRSKQARRLQDRLAHVHDGPIRIRNVHVFDARTGERTGPVSVRVEDGRIQEVGRADAATAGPDELVIDGEGGTLLPGLTDMHAHNSTRSGPFYLAAGVTSTRDMGNDNDELMELTRGIEAGELAGPRIVRNGFIEGRSEHSAINGVIPETLEEALDYVAWYADNGYWQIKIYNSMNPDWVEPLASEAHRLGLGVTGHVPAFSTPDRVIQEGYDEIAHINQLMLGWLLDPGEDTRTPLRLTAMARAAELDLSSEPVQKTVALMRERGTAIDPTAVILERLMLSRAGATPPGDVDYLDHMPIGYQRYRKRTFVPLDEESDDARYRKAFGTILETLAMLHENGIQLLPGTDDGTGFTVHRELELYAEAGIPPSEVLRLATLGVAEYMGRDDEVGAVEPGKLADLVLVAGDPTANIDAVKTPRLVMKGGVIYLPAQIYRELGIEPFAPPPEGLPAEWMAGT